MRNGVFFETSDSLLRSTKTYLENKPLLNMYARTKKIKVTNKNSRTREKMDNRKNPKQILHSGNKIVRNTFDKHRD